MATVNDLMHKIKDVEELAVQVEALKQMTQMLDPATHKLAFTFLRELTVDEIYYPELRPFAIKCLEFIVKKYSLNLTVPQMPAADPDAPEKAKPVAPQPKGPVVGAAPANTVCSACGKMIEGNCVIHEVPIADVPRALHFCSKPCYGELTEVVEKLSILAAVRKATGADLIPEGGYEDLTPADEETPTA